MHYSHDESAETHVSGCEDDGADKEEGTNTQFEEETDNASVSHDEYMEEEVDQLPLSRGTEHPTCQDSSSVAETAALKDVEMDVGKTRAGRRGQPTSNKKKFKTGKKVKRQKQGQRDEAVQVSSDMREYNAGSQVQGPIENRVLEDKNQGPQEIQSERRGQQLRRTLQHPERYM